jgi:hypothetical protein
MRALNLEPMKAISTQIEGITTLYKIVKIVSLFCKKIFLICRTFVGMIYYLILIQQAWKRKATGGAFLKHL